MPLPKCVRTKVDMPGWREIGNFVIYERPPREIGYTEFVRYREHWELSVIKAIAEHFEFDRLHMDPAVAEEDADQFKKDMIDNAIANDWPVMTCGQPMTLGFLIIRPKRPTANIDLIAVHPEHRHKHIATYLVAHFLYWAHENGFDLCRAGTMEANAAACCLYEAAGFKRVDCLRTFHK